MARKQALSKNGGGVIGASGCTTHTSPFRADTDFDGVYDGDEYRNGTNPLDPRSP